MRPTISQVRTAKPLTAEQLSLLYGKGMNILKGTGWVLGKPIGKRVGVQPASLLPLEVITTKNDVHLFNYIKLSSPDDSYSVCTLQKLNNCESNSKFRVLPHILILCEGIELLALIDTGSEITCISEEFYNKIISKVKLPVLPLVSTQLRCAMGQQSSRIKIQTWLRFTILGLDSDIVFENVFLVVKNLVRPVIIGIDWLHTVSASINLMQGFLEISRNKDTYRIPVNSNAKMVGDSMSQSGVRVYEKENCAMLRDLSSTVTPVAVIKSKIFEITAINQKQHFQLLNVLLKHHLTFNELPGLTNKYTHVIKMKDTTPFLRKPYPIPFSLRPEVDKTIENMLKMGVIKREASPFASPMTVVRKKDGSVRICLDARWLNKQMIADCESPRSMEDLLHSFSSIKCMSTIDLRSSYWQIPLDPQSTQYTAFLYNGKSYTYQVLPFGLKTAVGSFSRALDLILGPEVREFTVNYIDDLLIVSDSFENHMAHLDQVLQKLKHANITINLEKTHFLKDRVLFLGHILTSEGISTDPEKLCAIREFPVPVSIKHLRAFLGLCNYYRRFNRKYSYVTQPLNELLKKNVRWNWGENEQLAFDRTKALFLDTVVLKFPNFKKTFYLQTDSSGTALGAELYQLLENNEHGVIGFASRILRGPELMYTVTEKELLAIIYGLQKYRTIILGYKVIIRTDHYALKFLKHCKILNERLTRWMLFLNQFDYEVEHVRGKDNVVADVLSRFPTELKCVQNTNGQQIIVAATIVQNFISAIFEITEFETLKSQFLDLKEKQLADPFFGPLFNHLLQRGDNLDHKQAKLIQNFEIHKHLLLYVNKMKNKFKIALPDSMAENLIRSVHEQYGHFGISKIYSVVKENFFTPKLRQQVRQIIRSCDICQKVKYPQRHLSGTMQPILAENPGDLVTVDYYGPLPESRSRVAYIFVVIDSFSKFVKLYPLRRAQAKISALKLVDDYSKFIKPKVVLSDHGTQFLSRHWRDTLLKNNIKPTLSSIRHPSSNPTERVMKELSRLFRTYCHRSHKGWAHYIPQIEALFNSSPHLSTGYSPNQLIFGKNPQNAFDKIIFPLLPHPRPETVEEMRLNARNNLKLAAQRRSQHFKTHHDKLNVGDFVLLRENPHSDASNKIVSKFCLLYSGPYQITDRPYPNTYSLKEITTGEKKGNYNIANLKLYRMKQPSGQLHM